MLGIFLIFSLFLHVFTLQINEKLVENSKKEIERNSDIKISRSRVKRQHGKVEESYLWPNATVPLFFDPAVISNFFSHVLIFYNKIKASKPPSPGTWTTNSRRDPNNWKRDLRKIRELYWWDWFRECDRKSTRIMQIKSWQTWWSAVVKVTTGCL